MSGTWVRQLHHVSCEDRPPRPYPVPVSGTSAGAGAAGSVHEPLDSDLDLPAMADLFADDAKLSPPRVCAARSGDAHDEKTS